MRIQDLKQVVACLPGTYSDDKPPKYEPISVSAVFPSNIVSRRLMRGLDLGRAVYHAPACHELLGACAPSEDDFASGSGIGVEVGSSVRHAHLLVIALSLRDIPCVKLLCNVSLHFVCRVIA